MVFALTWLPQVLEGAGLKVAEVPGWRGRGRGEMGRVRGVICHHTAGARHGNMPSLDLLVAGRPDLPGPLAQLGLGRDGTWYVIAAGRCNHAGKGLWRGVDGGNTNFIGIEAENCGRPDDAWPEVQMDAFRRGVAAVLKFVEAEAAMCCGHKEYALPAGRKTDPLFDMEEFRAQVREVMSGRAGKPALIPAIDARARPTLRRGARGDLVKALQRALGLVEAEADGIFGGATEARVREAQRGHGLTPDGIVGPKTWEAIQPAAGAAPAASPAPVAAAAPAGLPPPDDTTRPPKLAGIKALTPDGRPFAQVFRDGFFTRGDTTVGDWLGRLGQPLAGLSPSAVRVVRAVSENEGRLEAINSYDGCFISVGIFQWTAGLKDEAGELPALLARFKQADAAAYEDCFGRYAVDVDLDPGGLTGRLVVAGKPLRTAREKAVLRGAVWAYRFWRAGHHDAFRQAQVAFAAERIGRFVGKPLLGRKVSDWMTSEYAVALVLDQHVNRPGHVPGTLETSLRKLLGDQAEATDPAGWSEADELRSITAYLVAREATSMTHADKRAAVIGDRVRKGLLSDDRRSFVA